MKISLKRVILLFITCIFLFFVFRNIDIKELLKLTGAFDCGYIILLVISIICSLACRGICFKILISSSVKAPLKDLIPLCLTGAALNIVLPARAGDIFRAYYTGDKYGADKIKIFGTVMLERIFDGLIILIMLFCAIALYNKSGLAKDLCYICAFIFIVALITAFVTFKFNKTDEICTFLKDKSGKLPEKLKNILFRLISFFNRTCNSFINGFEVLQYPKKLLMVVCASFGIWFFECLNYYIVIQAFGCDVSWSVVLFIIGFVALACMIPSTSIFIGPYQAAVIAAFAIYNINKETALAISIVEQLIVTITLCIIAALFLIRNNISYEKIKENLSDSEYTHTGELIKSPEEE
ncbi:MAG: flippase-like domain-containing protein [Candidatus Gastranaerophilales bacterium]|nr:flippase-like domain-containing protein [Candidatus Gastranaerophilales bacterium]